MSNLFSNLVNKIKTKTTTSNLEVRDEYAFSLEEIDSLKEENDKKIKDLKEDRIGLKKEEDLIVVNINYNNEEKAESMNDDEGFKKAESEEINSSETKLDTNSSEEIEETETDEKELVVNEDNEETKIETEEKGENESFINLSSKNQELIMRSWNAIDNNGIDKDIINGKDILSHNYNITYGDNAAKFVHDIRKKYEIVICYLIGFNNEKNGIMNKTIFSDRMDNEWKYLENYIKLLEKIRNFKK